MTTTTSPCEEFEIAALRRARGALEFDATTRLDAHLGTCAACRAFDATAQAIESALRGRIGTAAASRNWDAVREAFRARMRDRRRSAIAAWALIPPLVAVFWWTLPPLLFWCLFAWLAVMLAVASRGGAAEADRARRAEAVDDELLAFYRADLDREIAVIRGSRPLFPVLTVSFGVLIVASLAVLATRAFLDSGPFDWPPYLMPLVVLPLVYVWLWRRARFVLPRLERERAELGE